MVKTIKGFKFIQENMKSRNGDCKWKVGEWKKYEGKLSLCDKGFHACLTPQQSLDYIYGAKWFIIEARGEIIYEKNDKFVASEMRLVKEIKLGEYSKISKKYKKPLDTKKLEKELENIPTKKDVINLIKRIDKIKWFKPQKKPNKDILSRKIKAIIQAFGIKVGFGYEIHKLEKKEDWDSARASARDSAWDSAWDSARASAWDSARASARDSARDSAWDSARASAWASARASAWDSAWDSARASAWASAWDSAWDSAWASARASEFEIVKDLMKEKGYENNPFKLLLELWELGLYPVGVLKDKKFHIYYVPLKKRKNKK